MEELLNQKYKIRMEVLTPLSVGAGAESDWSKGVDYVTENRDDENKLLYHLNINKMLRAGVDMSKFAALIALKNEQGVKNLLGNRLPRVSDQQMNMPCSSNNDIKTFCRNQLSGHPIVPGSSLKGAIRSVLFSVLRGDHDTRNESVFGKIQDGSDFMRFIRISDFEFDQTQLVNTKIYNLHKPMDNWEGGWKHATNNTRYNYDNNGFNTIYECVMPHQTAEGYIMLTEKLFKEYTGQQPCRAKKDALMSHEDDSEPIDNLFYEITKHTQNYLIKERNFFKKYKEGEHSDHIIGSINWLVNKIRDLDAGECIIKMSAGSGFHSITGDWQYTDYTETGIDNRTGKKKYKSRKIAVNDGKYRLMGFVKLTIVE